MLISLLAPRRASQPIDASLQSTATVTAVAELNDSKTQKSLNLMD